jgi:hypothetical protein
MEAGVRKRPGGITALSILFLVGAVMSSVSSVTLAFPGGPLEPLWRLNQPAHEAFGRMGGWAILLLLAVGAACGLGAVGLWRGERWGYALGVVLITVNLAGGVANLVLGTDPRAAAGIPIAAGILLFLLSRRARSFFGLPAFRIGGITGQGSA